MSHTCYPVRTTLGGPMCWNLDGLWPSEKTTFMKTGGESTPLVPSITINLIEFILEYKEGD